MKQPSLVQRLFSVAIWRRRLYLWKLRVVDAVRRFFLRFSPAYRVGVVGDFEHFMGSKLKKAENFRVVNGKRVVFLPFAIGHTYDLLIKWEPFARVDAPAFEGRVINGAMTHIDKRSIDAKHVKIFGRGLLVDPTRFEGSYLLKDAGTPDGAGHSANHTPEKILSQPIDQMDERYVYSRLIDNTDDDGNFIDYRLYVIGGEVWPTCCCIRLSERFGSQPSGASPKSLHLLEALFNEPELKGINQFVTALRLDYGELDVIRDRQTGELYIVDVNNTPYGDFRWMGFSNRETRDMYRKVLISP